MNTKILPVAEKTNGAEQPLKSRKNKKSVNVKAALFKSMFAITFFTVSVIFILARVSAWYDEHRIVFHQVVEIKVNPLFTIETRVVSPVVDVKESGASVSPTPTPTEKPQGMKLGQQVLAASLPVSHKDIIMGKKNGDIMWVMYGLESSYGKNDSCSKEGKYNGFGYIPGNCYEYFEQVAFRVDNWLEEKLAVHDLPTALCGYNLGFDSVHLKECVNKSAQYPYYRDYLALGGKI